MIEDTQKNVDHMRTKMNLGPSSSASKVQKGNYNSQSAQSLSSHLVASKGTSNGDQNNLKISGLGEHQRSILIEDPPKSYRSGRQEVTGMPILPINNL
jgi:hypothetical protein